MKLCRLCLKNVPDMKAHIIAQGLLKLISKNNDGNYTLLSNNTNKRTKRPSGSFDSNILCNICDKKLGKYDEIAINFSNNKTIETYIENDAYIIKNINQNGLKLFCMSLLWRCSITDLPEFDGVSLGNKHEEKLRTMIQANYSGNFKEYSVIVSKYTIKKDEELHGSHIWVPFRQTISNVNIYNIYLPNLYKITFKVDQRTLPNNLEDLSLGVKEDIIVLNLGDYHQSSEFKVFHKIIMNSKNRQNQAE